MGLWYWCFLRSKSFDFDVKGMVFELNPALNRADCGVRTLFTKFDHLSHQSRSFYPRIKPKNPGTRILHTYIQYIRIYKSHVHTYTCMHTNHTCLLVYMSYVHAYVHTYLNAFLFRIYFCLNLLPEPVSSEAISPDGATEVKEGQLNDDATKQPATEVSEARPVSWFELCSE